MATKRDDVIGTLQHAFALDPDLDAPKIHVIMIGDDEALMTGLVDTPEQRMKAEDLARKAVPGLNVDNGLAVGLNRRSIDDGHLQAQAQEIVANAQDQLHGRPSSVSVEVIGGKAHLRGSCSTAADRRYLIECVARVPDLAGVIADDLAVAPFGTADDLRLTNIAEARLREESYGLAGSVVVTVRDRSAELTGTVRDDREKHLAERLVMQVPGITHVRNHLQLSQSGARSSGDFKLQQAVIHALGRAGLPMPNLHVFVVADMVWLDGEVETIEQKQEAERVARACDGVHQLDNRLKVNQQRGDMPLPESRLNQVEPGQAGKPWGQK